MRAWGLYKTGFFQKIIIGISWRRVLLVFLIYLLLEFFNKRIGIKLENGQIAIDLLTLRLNLIFHLNQ